MENESRISLRPYETLKAEDRFKPAEENIFIRRFQALCGDPGIETITFDFFDTVVWRPFRRPTDTFWNLGVRLIEEGVFGEDFTPAKFTHARPLAERHARDRKERSGGFHEVTLTEIYLEFKGLTPQQQEIACRLEVEHEALYTLADPNVYQAMEHAKALGKTVYVISNTYFSNAELAVIAKGKSPFLLTPEDFFCSSAYGMDKEVGLVSFVVSELGLHPSSVLHVGDNPYGDFEMPRRAGINALLYEKFSDAAGEVVAREDRYDMLVGDEGEPRVDLLSQWRRMRVAVSQEGRLRKPSEAIGMDIVGPALSAFAHWAIEEIHRQGEGPILCLTREGLLLHETLQTIAPQIGRDGLISLPFLSSRSIIFSCCLFDFTVDELEEFFYARRTPFSVKTFCDLLGDTLDISDMNEFPKELIEYPLIEGAALSDAAIAALADFAPVKKAALDYSTRQRAIFKRYVDAAFERHGIPGDAKVFYAMDVGWTGCSQKLLKRILNAIGYDVDVRGLYFATTNSSRNQHILGLKAKGWLYDGGLPAQEAVLGLQCKEIIEQVCSSHLGAVRTYDENGDPVFEAVTKDLSQRIELRRLRNAAREVIATYGEVLQLARTAGLEAELINPRRYRTAYGALMTFPTNDEYAMISGWAHEENNLSDQVETLTSNYWRFFARYATPRQYLEGRSYWKIPEFIHARPQLADAILSQSRGLPPTKHERKYPFAVEVKRRGVFEERRSVEVFFALDNVAIVSLSHVGNLDSAFTFTNRGSEHIVIDAVLVSYYQTFMRERFERILLPDFENHPSTSGNSSSLAPGAAFMVRNVGEPFGPFSRMTPMTVICCVRLA